MERVDECEADEDRRETPIGHFRKGVHRLFEWTTIDHIEHWWYCDGGNMVPPGKNRYSGPLAVSLLAGGGFTGGERTGGQNKAGGKENQRFSRRAHTVRPFNYSISYNY